ncbi:MAG: HAMP domain-containing histidine kinase [Thermoplasmatales archaeon]|nr:MAG: HAMP domain-containing histidine kinase [Thermoplasmatales archaeon]
MRNEPEIANELRKKDNIENHNDQSKIRKMKFGKFTKSQDTFFRKNKQEHIDHIKKVAIKTIGVGIFLTIVIESYYIFVIADITFFNAISNIALVSIVFLLGTAYVLQEFEKVEKNLREAHNQLNNLNRNLEQKVKKRTDEVVQLLNEKQELINQLSHDLKTPLTPLVNLLPILENTENDPKSKELLKILHRNVDNIKHLVVNTLDLSRLNTPGTVLDIEDINLRVSVEDSIKDQQLLCDEKEFKVDNKIDENIYIKADKIRLGEVFSNLVNNAVRYSPYGSTITVKAHDDGDFVKVSIIDSGIGMTDEQIDRIFDDFYKADKSRHDFSSSGLGLSICKNIVEKHGGRIWAESPGLGKGSTFYFKLPKDYKKNEIKSKEDFHQEIDMVLKSKK